MQQVQVLCSEQQPCSHLRVLRGGCSVLSCCAEGLEKGSWHLCSATCCQRQLSPVLLFRHVLP